MPQLAALLVSHAAPLIRVAREALRTTYLLELCGEVSAACSRLGESGASLVLAHLEAQAEPGTLTPLLEAAGRLSRPVVVLAERCCEEDARALLAAGAAAYLALPGDLAAFARLASAAAVPRAPDPFWDDSLRDDDLPELPELLAQVRRVATQNTTLLLTGETGTGKTRLARLVHELSPRRNEPFLVLDCGALSASLIERELFGHVRGAFTGADRDRPGKLASAGRGTLLLDEVNLLPPALQGKLLRALDERAYEAVGSDRPQPVLARVLAASTCPLEREVAQGRFRRDLFHRLNVVGLQLPPLRARPGRIAPLAQRFLAECARRGRPDVAGLSPAALRLLEIYVWPGNVRELRNVIERAVALCPGPFVSPQDLPEAIRFPQEQPAAAALSDPGATERSASAALG